MRRPLPGAGFAYLLALAGVLVGGFYSFRLVFYAFHGKERFADPHDPAVKACDAERAQRMMRHAHDDEHA